MVWNLNFIFPYFGNVIIPTDEFSIIFLGRSTNHQTSAPSASGDDQLSRPSPGAAFAPPATAAERPPGALAGGDLGRWMRGGRRLCGECHFHGEKLEIFLKNQRWDVDGCSAQEMVLYQFFLQRFVRSNIAMNCGISQGETPMALPVWPFFGNVRHPILEVNHFEPCPFLMWIEMGTPFTTPMSLAGSFPIRCGSSHG